MTPPGLEFFTSLLMTHQDSDQVSAIQRRHAAITALQELGFDVVGANTDDDPRSMAVALVMDGDGR